MVYVGDYSSARYVLDIELKIDNKEVLKDDLTESSVYMPDFIISEKLRYGLHKINVHSVKANVSREKHILLLPNQHIVIEFLPADTLTLEYSRFKNTVIMNELQVSDSMIERYKLSDSLDFLNYTIIREKSDFIIESRFNPFYTE